MYAKLLGFLLFACQIISNGSPKIIPAVTDHNPVMNVTDRSVTLPEGYVRFPEIHAAYKIHKESETWVEAREHCVADGGDLAITDTIDKIKKISGTQSRISDWINVGIRHSQISEEWVRVDNSHNLTSLPWREGNPDDAGDCVGISFNGEELVNFSCDGSSNWYVCEIPIQED